MSAASPGLIRRLIPSRGVLAVTLGNGLEFYDFMVYAFFAIQIGQAFFPSHDPYTGLMASLATFGAGFITRPLGAWLLGGHGDRHGRSHAMQISMILMGLAILMLVLCPGYDQIGIAAPVIAVLARLLQGFALGGDVGPATAYLMESAGSDRRGLLVSYQRASQLLAGAIGSLAGLLLSLIMPEAAFQDYGWRIALGLGALIVPYAVMIRRNMPEHPAPESSIEDERLEPGIRRTVLCGMLIMGGSTIAAYVMTYMATFAQATLKLSSSVALAGQTTSNLAGVFACLLGGVLSDRIGRRPVLIASYSGAMVLGPLAFLWMTAMPGALSLIGGTVLIGTLMGIGNSPANTSLIESLPRRVRSRGFAMIYTLPVTVLGGTTQLAVTWLTHVTGSPMAVVWYCSGALSLSLIGMALIHESAPIRLARHPSDPISS